MCYSVFESAHAARDLDMAVSYLVNTLKTKSAATKLLKEYERLLEALEETPTVYPLVRDELLAFAGYHWAPISSYLAFHTIDEEAKEVHIHRIAHGSRNWIQLL